MIKTRTHRSKACTRRTYTAQESWMICVIDSKFNGNIDRLESNNKTSGGYSHSHTDNNLFCYNFNAYVYFTFNYFLSSVCTVSISLRYNFVHTKFSCCRRYKYIYCSWHAAFVCPSLCATWASEWGVSVRPWVWVCGRERNRGWRRARERESDKREKRRMTQETTWR